MVGTLLWVIIGLVAVALPLSSDAAPVVWGSWTAVSDHTAIHTPGGYTTYGGVNFNGSTTTINNGTMDVTFTGIAQNASGTAAGITVATSGFGFQSTGNNSNVVSAVGAPQTWGTVLDRVIGDSDNSASITLSGLTVGTNYYVQFFSSAPDANILATSKIASGGVDSPLFGNHVSGGTRSIVGSFTANGTSQTFALTGTEPTYSALVIGVQPPVMDTTPPTWIAGWPQAAPLSATSLVVRAKINEVGIAYYVVLPGGSTAPSAAQVKAGTNSSNVLVAARGSIALVANAENTASVTGLTTDSTHGVYVVAEDAIPNLQAAPSVVSVTLSSVPLEPVISEFVAVGSTHLDENLTSQDWIEIHNPNGFSINLTGYYLTDDPALLTKWVFPATTLAGGGYAVVFASDKNRAVSGSPLHTNFKLTAAGEYLALVKPNGTTVVSAYSPTFPGQVEGFSYGRNSSGTNGYFSPTTPGAANGPLVPHLPPLLSPACGTFTTSIAVTITDTIPGVGNVIRYTTNGNEPTTSSTLYSGTPITISSTTHLRARVFSSLGAAGAVSGGVYQQLATTSNLAGINSPSTFDSNLPIMVVENFGAGAIPAVTATTLQTARLSVYSPPIGNSALTATPDACFRIGIKRRGNSSKTWPQGQYRVELRDEADGDLAGGLLGMPADSDWTLHGPYPDKSLIRNALIYDLGREIGIDAPRTRHFELFLNLDGGDLQSSDYAGVYVLVEKIKQGNNRTNIASLNPTDNAEPEVTGGYIIHHDEPFHIIEGGGGQPTNWRSLEIDEPRNPTVAQKNYIGQYMDNFVATLGWSRWTGANDAGVINNNPLTGYPAFIDTDSFVNLLIMNELTRNQDSYVASDYMYKDRGGKLFKGPLWDFNLTMGIGCCHNNTALRTGWMLSLTFCRGGSEHSWEPDVMVPLLRDADFRQQWIDKWFRLRRYGALTTAALNARIDSHATPLSAAAARHFVKWPLLGSSSVGGFNSPVTTTWTGQIDFMKTWLQDRMPWIDAQFPGLVALAPNASVVSAGAPVTMTASGGTIYYTTDGSDPRLPGGGVSPTAVAVSSGGTVTINATTTFIARTFFSTWSTTPTGATWGATWSAPTRVTYVIGSPASAANLLVTEMNYHPSSPATAAELADPTFRNDDFEFIEVKNNSGGAIELSGIAFTGGIALEIMPGQVLAPGEYGVFVESIAAFRARYGNGPRVLGVYSDKLDNGGEPVRLVDFTGATIQSFTFADTWFPTTDGAGYTLAAVSETTGADLSNPLSWTASSRLLGTPGMANNSIGFPGWLRENFTEPELADSLVSSPLADADGDGIATLMEFALGLDPHQPNLSLALPTGQTVNVATKDHLALSFRRRKLATDVKYRALVSPDLLIWTETNTAHGTPVDNGDGTETVTFRDLVEVEDAPRRFMRLKTEW